MTRWPWMPWRPSQRAWSSWSSKTRTPSVQRFAVDRCTITTQKASDVMATSRGSTAPPSSQGYGTCVPVSFLLSLPTEYCLFQSLTHLATLTRTRMCSSYFIRTLGVVFTENSLEHNTNSSTCVEPGRGHFESSQVHLHHVCLWQRWRVA